MCLLGHKAAVHVMQYLKIKWCGLFVKLKKIKYKVCDTSNHKHKDVLYSQLLFLNMHILK